jgi:predicted HicB family RNase H-like nuclease
MNIKTEKVKKVHEAILETIETIKNTQEEMLIPSDKQYSGHQFDVKQIRLSIVNDNHICLKYLFYRN